MEEVRIIKRLISEGKTEEAIENLITFLSKNHSKFLNDAIILKGRWNDFKRMEIKGTISISQATIVKNQINDSLLSLLNFDYERQKNNKVVQKLKNKIKLNQLYNIISIFVTILILIYLIDKIEKANSYEKIIVKQNEYIDRLKLKQRQINQFESDLPKLQGLIHEFNNLNDEYIKSIKEGSYSLSSEIRSEIRELPTKYSINKVIDRDSLDIVDMVDSFDAIIQRRDWFINQLENMLRVREIDIEHLPLKPLALPKNIFRDTSYNLIFEN